MVICLARFFSSVKPKLSIVIGNAWKQLVKVQHRMFTLSDLRCLHDKYILMIKRVDARL